MYRQISLASLLRYLVPSFGCSWLSYDIKDRQFFFLYAPILILFLLSLKSMQKKGQRKLIVIQSCDTVSTLKSIRKSPDDFEIVSSHGMDVDLGRGAFGQVKLVKERQTGRLYAMKLTLTIENLKREIKIQRKLNHDNVIKLHHYFEDKRFVYLILEYAQRGTLFSYLRKRRQLSEPEAKRLFLQTCIGIQYLHSMGIIHRDLKVFDSSFLRKPENILLDEQLNIKICDFGWSADNYQVRKTLCGTCEYMAPEMIRNEPHNESIDIWALGILLYELLHGYSPFREASSDHEVLSNISRAKPYSFAKGLSAEAISLIDSLLIINPRNRPRISEILCHKWFSRSTLSSNVEVEVLLQIDRPMTGYPFGTKYYEAMLPNKRRKQRNDLLHQSVDFSWPWGVWRGTSD